MKIQFGTLFTLISAAIICGGFYHTTELRLESLEAEVSELSDQIKKIRKKKSRLKPNKKGTKIE